MPLYKYLAKDNRGKEVRNTMEGENPAVIADFLHQQDLTIISIEEFQQLSFSFSNFWRKIKKFQITEERIKLADILSFLTQLGAMLEAGLHITRALGSLAKETENRTMARVIVMIKQDVERGDSLHAALSRHPRYFSPLVVNLIRSGEISGQLDMVFKQLSEYLERMADLKRTVASILTYPLFLLSFMFLVLTFIMLKLVPVFQNTYAEFGVSLPLPTQILIHVSDFIRENILYILLIIAGGIVLLISLIRLKLEGLAYAIDDLKFKLPVFGPLIQKACFARFSRTLGIMISSGLPVIESLTLAGQTADNKLIEQATQDCIYDISHGSSIADSMAARTIFPEMLIQFTATGEQTGKLDSMLLSTARYYEKQMEAYTKVLTSLMEPILIIFMSVIVGAVLISIFMPIFYLGRAFMHQ